MGMDDKAKGPAAKAGMLWRRRDVREYLGVDEKVLKAWIAAGTLKPVTGLGKRAFFRRGDVMKLAGA